MIIALHYFGMLLRRNAGIALLLLSALIFADVPNAEARRKSRDPRQGNPRKERVKTLTDEDILDPRRLVFNKKVKLLDSFDGAPMGTAYISKRSVLGNPEYGVIGEPGSPRYRRYCLLFCPSGTSDIDATYVYVFQKKGECTIGVRGIGWAEIEEEFKGGLFTGRTVETGRVRYTSTSTNINYISINGVRVGPPENYENLAKPHGTNYKYFPRKKNFLGDQTTAESGYITDIHIFPAALLVAAANSGSQVLIEMPSWKPGRHLIEGKALKQLKSLTGECDVD